MATSILTAQTLRDRLDYDEATGVFTYRMKIGNRPKGSVAGKTTKAGYIAIRVNYGYYLAHRLAWLHVHGEWPNADIDHINGVRTDNRVANLRDVTRQVNLQNRRTVRSICKTSSSIGVRFETGKFRARIYVNGRNMNLGGFDTEEDAKQAYLTAKRKYHKGCTI